MKETAGTLLYRGKGEKLEVLLVHASGNYNKRAFWSIPKGLPEEDESLEETARRETMEETGIAAGALQTLGSIEYKKSRKRVHCFAGKAPRGAKPEATSWEIDKAKFVDIEKARILIHPDQSVFLDRLLDFLP